MSEGHQKKGKILVTPRSLSKNGHPFLRQLENAGYEVLTPFPGKQPDEAELKSVLPECIAYLAGVEKVSAEVLAECPKLKVISRNGVGIDNVDTEYAESHGITLCITRGANSRGVAELAIGLMFSLTRSLPAVNSSIKAGGWERVKGIEVQNRKIGVVGTGQIGKNVSLMAMGLGMEVLGSDLYPDIHFEKTYEAFRYASVDTLLENCDVITLHCPPQDRPLMDEEAFSRMKEGAYLINTARATLVDSDAALSALDSGKLAGYAVDAFDSEPPELTALLKHPKVILSSHIGGFTSESVDRATSAAIKNILEAL